MRAIIGGTGFYNLDYFENPKAQTVRTPFGSVKIFEGNYNGQSMFFLPRHGVDHTFLANQVNYRANIWGLKELEVDRIIGTSAVGSLNENMKPGDLVLLTQFVDFSKHRQDTFNFGSVNMTDPYCNEINNIVIQQAKNINLKIHGDATYVSVEGPRYETAAEIKVYKKLGMDVVGMTNGTEAVLARELGICYSVIGIITNMAAGLSNIDPNLENHKKVMDEYSKNLRSLALATVENVPSQHSCLCSKHGCIKIV